MKRAVVVFSGGQDSTTCLVQALQQYDEVHCVTFDYGQRHRAEIDVARELALKLGAVAHKVLDVTLLNELAVSSLTRDNIPVPDYQPDAEGIPSTFVPGRNILFLTLTAIYAYQVKAEVQAQSQLQYAGAFLLKNETDTDCTSFPVPEFRLLSSAPKSAPWLPPSASYEAP